MESTTELGYADLASRIRQRQANLSDGQRLVAEYLLNHYQTAAFLTAAALGRAVGVSESTVVRSAVTLGYSGYPELQRVLQEALKSRLTTVDRMLGSASLDDNGDLVSSIMQTDLENIRLTVEELPRAAFDEAVRRLAAAGRVFIIGMRSAYAPAYFLGFNLSWLGKDVRVIASGPGDMWERLVGVRPGDVVVGITFPRYVRETVEAVAYARNRGAFTIAITDSVLSPLSEHGDLTLPARSNIASFVDSYTAALSLINALLTAVSVLAKDDNRRTLAALEEIWEQRRTYMRN